jgi:hypothetical protein
MSVSDEYPKIGQYLYSTCSGSDYGRIVGRGKYEDQEEDKEYDTIDIDIKDPTDLIDDKFSESGVRLQGNVILCRVRYKIKDAEPDPWPGEEGPGIWIVCETPGDGCYRCKKAFRLRDEK